LKPFDSTGAFRPATDGLHRMAVRGAAATLFSSGFGLAIQIAATVVLTRLLTPEDFGLVYMVTTFSLLLANFGFNGFTEAVIQWEKLDHTLASNLFWINIGAGALLTLAFAASGSALAWFYEDPRIEYAVAGVSLTILLSSAWVLHTALLKRAMRFSAVSMNEICARAVAVVVSIFLGWLGWGYWALVAGAVALPLSTTIGAWILCRWTPGLPARAAETGPMVRFALNVYGRFTVNYAGRNMDNFLVGWHFNAQILGFYKKAYDLFALSAGQLISPLAHVAVSALSRLNQDPAQYKRYLLSAMGIVAFVGMGVGADLTLVGRHVIRLLLGPGWEPSGPIFMIFGPGIGIMMLYATHGWIHLSIGRADRWFRWGIVEFVTTLVLFLVALPWGPMGIAAAWTASFWILTAPALWYAGKPIQLEVGAVIGVVWKFVVASFLAGSAAALLLQGGTSAGPSSAADAFFQMVIKSLVFGVLYLAAVIGLHRGCAPLYQVAGLMQEMLRRNKSPKAPAAGRAARAGAVGAATLSGSKD
jgi:O-antigen/teichoic acid export membrane protein